MSDAATLMQPNTWYLVTLRGDGLAGFDNWTLKSFPEITGNFHDALPATYGTKWPPVYPSARSALLDVRTPASWPSPPSESQWIAEMSALVAGADVSEIVKIGATPSTPSQKNTQAAKAHDDTFLGKLKDAIELVGGILVASLLVVGGVILYRKSRD